MRWRPALLIAVLCAKTAGAAPLPPNTGSWADDAVRVLVEKGLLKGPETAALGRRVMTRYELSVLLERVLERLESEHQDFASREAANQLLEQLRAGGPLNAELELLRNRLTNLERQVADLDQRVTEKERITFYGRFEARVIGASFTNTGSATNGPGVSGRVPFLNYNTEVGALAAPTWRQQVQAVAPVVDYTYGRALVNGAGSTERADLGVKLKVSPDIDAGIEFSAFSSQGNKIIDGYWGVNAPFLSNPTVASAVDPAFNNQPFTKMTLNQAWFLHKPSQTRLVLGQIDQTTFDPLVYVGAANLNLNGPARLPGYGGDVSGKVGGFSYEVMASRLGDGVNYMSTDYLDLVVGGNVAYQWEDGKVRLDFVRITNDNPSGDLLLAGLDATQKNVRYGASSGWTTDQWVNPPGYFAFQNRSGQNTVINGTFIPSATATRPIAGWSKNADNAIAFSTGGGNFGPQDLTSGGLSFNQSFLVGEGTRLRFGGEYAHSDYRANRNSSFHQGGNAGRFELGLSLDEGTYDLALAFLTVDPTYDPMHFSGNLIGVRNMRTFDLTGVFYLHDNALYPHNRQGFLGSFKWNSPDKRATVFAGAQLLSQTRTSLYDVRVVGHSIAPVIPTNDVIGFAPGFVDPIFSGYAQPQIYGTGSANSFTKNLQPLEDPRGHVQFFNLGGRYNWEETNLSFEATLEHRFFERNSSLAASLGGSQNQVNLGTNFAGLGIKWTPDEHWVVGAGVDIVGVEGHLDPAGLYNRYALTHHDVRFDNIDVTQKIPNATLIYKFDPQTQVGLNLRYYLTDDHLGPGTPAGDRIGSAGASAHPFSWSGLQTTMFMSTRF